MAIAGSGGAGGGAPAGGKGGGAGAGGGRGGGARAAPAPPPSKLRLGLMVGPNTFRNPGHTAKLATTLDHLSGGRAVLGIGAAWVEREHEAFGIDFGSGFGA